MTGTPTSWQVLDQGDADRARDKGHKVSTYDYTVPGPGSRCGVAKRRVWIVWAKDSAGAVPADTGAGPASTALADVQLGGQPGPAPDS